MDPRTGPESEDETEPEAVAAASSSSTALQQQDSQDDQRPSSWESEPPLEEKEECESCCTTKEAESIASDLSNNAAEPAEEKKEDDSGMRNRDFIIQRAPYSRMSCSRIWYPPPWLSAEKLFRNPLEFRVAVSKKMALLGEQSSLSFYTPSSVSSNSRAKASDSAQKNSQSTTAFRHPRSKFRMGGGIGGGMGGGIGGGIGGGMGGKLCGDGDSFHEPPPGHVRPANQNRTFYY